MTEAATPTPRRRRTTAAATAAAQLAEQEKPSRTEGMRVLGEMGSNAATVMVYRIRDNGRESYLGEASTRLFGMEWARRSFGPGDYMARVFDADGNELGTQDFSIEPLPGENAPVSKQPEESTSAMLRVILEEIARGRQTQTTQKDPMELAAQLGAISAQNMATMMTAITRLLPTAAPGTSPEKMFDFFTRGMEMGKEMGGSSGEGYGPVISQLGKPLLEILQRQQGIDAAAVGNPSPQQPPQLTEGEEMKPMKAARDDTPFSLLAPAMPQLQNLASQNAPIEMWAAVVETEYPQIVAILGNIADRIGMDKTLETFFEVFPDVVPQREWFTKLLDSLLTVPEDSTEPTEPTE